MQKKVMRKGNMLFASIDITIPIIKKNVTRKAKKETRTIVIHFGVFTRGVLPYI
jgi:hypothetical protein